MAYEHPTPLPAGVALTPSKATGPVEPKPAKQAAEKQINSARIVKTCAGNILDCLKRGWIPETLEQIGAIRAEIDKLETQLRNDAH